MGILKEVDKAVELAGELGDQWVGTTIGRILDSERDNLLSIVRANDIELASVAVLNLLNTCEYAEKQLNEAGDL